MVGQVSRLRRLAGANMSISTPATIPKAATAPERLRNDIDS
jgi:hypothetical protein